MKEGLAQREERKIAAIDPGEHIGFAFFDDKYSTQLTGTVQGEDEALDVLFDLIKSFRPDTLVVEAFRLYPHKALQQSWSTMRTPEIIGVIKYWARQNDYPVVLQPASCKQAFPDERLRKMGLYVPNVHARDAIRHGLYRQRFGKKEKEA